MPHQAPRQITQIVGTNLRAARDAKGLTQKQVADAVGATPNDVSRWENGRIEPGGKYRQLLADTLFDGRVGGMYHETEEVVA